MGTKFANARGKDLYQFWGSLITERLNQHLAQQDNPKGSTRSMNTLKAAANQINAKIITIFQDYKNGQYKIISFYAKKARGMMYRYGDRASICNNRSSSKPSTLPAINLTRRCPQKQNGYFPYEMNHLQALLISRKAAHTKIAPNQGLFYIQLFIQCLELSSTAHR